MASFFKDKPPVLMTVFPHPDDETVMAGGLMQQAADRGMRVVSVCLTHGEMGRMYIHGKGRNMAECRRTEYLKALNILGISEYFLWKYPDGNLSKYSDWQRPLMQLIEEINPGMMVTYGANGLTGHPDHIAVSRFVYQMNKKYHFSLWWVGEDEIFKQAMRHRENQVLRGSKEKITLSYQERWKKWRATLAYQSQNLGLTLQSFGCTAILYEEKEAYIKPYPEYSYSFKQMPFEI